MKIFLYSKGYEIKGSETSYNLVNDDKQTTHEILKYFLILKTIYVRDGYTLVNKDKHEHFIAIDLLMEKIQDLDYYIIQTTLINPNNVYPEIKHKMLNIIVKETNADLSVFEHPALYSYLGYNGFTEIIVQKNRSENCYEGHDNVNSGEYYNHTIINSYYTVDILIPLGASYIVHYYNLYKLSQNTRNSRFSLHMFLSIAAIWKVNLYVNVWNMKHLIYLSH